MLLAEHINSLDCRLSAWRPTPPPGFTNQFNSRDAIFLLTQARVYRCAALAILHRLQHPFGEADDLAVRYSFYILSESALCTDLLRNENTIPKTLFPWMIAGVELTRPEDRQAFLAQMPAEDREIMAMPIARMKEFCEYIWRMRDEGKCLSWFDLVASAPPFSVMPWARFFRFTLVTMICRRSSWFDFSFVSVLYHCALYFTSTTLVSACIFCWLLPRNLVLCNFSRRTYPRLSRDFPTRSGIQLHLPYHIHSQSAH